MQPTNRVNIRFILHPPGPRSKEGVLYVRATVNGVRAPQKSTGIKINPDVWVQKEQRVSGKSSVAGMINTRITQLKAYFEEAENRFILAGDAITAKKLVEAVMGDKAEPLTFKSVYSQYVEHRKLTSHNSENTFQGYNKYFANISLYMEQSGQKNTLITDIDDRVFIGLIKYLKERFKEDYAVKNANFFKAVYRFAFNKGLVKNNPFESFTLKRSGVYDTTHITTEEIRKLANFDFSTLPFPADSIRVLDEERDAFLLTCFTGLHHSDYIKKQFKITEYKGSQWIEGFRVKSERGQKSKPYTMKLHPIVLSIIDKYNGVYNLPIRNNYKRNLILKQIAAYVGINKHLTTKIGRKTCANYCLNVLNMSLEETAKVLGHSSLNFVKYYADIDKSRLDNRIHFERDGL